MRSNRNRISFGDLFQFKPRGGGNTESNDNSTKSQIDSPSFSSQIKEIEVICVDEEATPFATFQSHCQKVVSNDNGIFFTYIKTRNEKYTAQKWRLMWTPDMGKGFKVLYESTDATNPAPLETDEDNNIYLVYPDLMAQKICNIDVRSCAYDRNVNSYFMIFKAWDNYANPTVTPIKDSAGDKVCLIYDRPRKQFYYFSNNGTFHVIDKSGKVKHRNHIIRKIGEIDSLQYPHLSLDDRGTIHAAWTTEMLHAYHYLSLQYMKTENVGYTWKRMGGRTVELPVTCDHEGDTDRITTDEEFELDTWLSNFMALEGKLHFIYRAIPHPDLSTPGTRRPSMDKDFFVRGKQHYLRYDISSGEKDFEMEPDFSGQEISISGCDGFFAADPRNSNSPLYYVSKQGNRLACLASHDNGITWVDYAVSRELVKNTFLIFAIGGCREITKDGYIIGTFTEVCGDRERDVFVRSKVHFIKIKVDRTFPSFVV